MKTTRYAGVSITAQPDYPRSRAYGGYGELVARPAEVRAALLCGWRPWAKEQFVLI